MNRKLTPERISRAIEFMELSERILPVKAAAYNAKYAKDAINIADLMERNSTALTALEAVEKIFAWCKTVLNYSEEPCDGPVNSAHNVYMYGKRECAKKILKILGGENEK